MKEPATLVIVPNHCSILLALNPIFHHFPLKHIAITNASNTERSNRGNLIVNSLQFCAQNFQITNNPVTTGLHIFDNVGQIVCTPKRLGTTMLSHQAYIRIGVYPDKRCYRLLHIYLLSIGSFPIDAAQNYML